MSKIEQFYVGQQYFQADILVNGRDTSGHEGDCFTTELEAVADGECLAADFDTEWQKRNPGCVQSYVRQYVVRELDLDGTVGYAETV
jgi:hypothetical protein